MKIVINKILTLLAISLLLGSCQEVEDQAVLNPAASTVIEQILPEDVVLSESEVGSPAMKISWTKPEFGFAASYNYQLLIDFAGGDFSTPQIVSVGTDIEKIFETEELNKLLLNLGVEPDNPTQLIAQVRAILSSTVSIDSQSSPFTATAYSAVLDLSSPWGLVGSAAPNGWDGPDVPFYKSTTQANTFIAYTVLSDGEWKIRKDNSWDVNFGSDANDGTLQPGGANIPVDAGIYKVTFNEAALTYSIEAYAWGLVGSATTNGWDGPDMPLTYDPFTDTWRADVQLVEGEFKVRKDNSWTTNYGDTGLDGTLDQDGDNIPVTAGYYHIQVDFNDLTYTLEPTEVYGVVGSGYNDWGATPDFPFTPDYSMEGIYHAKNVPLLDGEIKFRINNDWGVNYGDTGLDGTLDQDGDNIPSVAGNYDIELDFTNPDTPTYTITAK